MATKNTKKRYKTDELIKRAGDRCMILNAACALIFAVILLLFFCDFFRLSIDGTVENKISGFTMSFLLFGNTLKKSGGILNVNKKYLGAIQFASAASLLCLITIIALLCIFIYRAANRKPVLSKPILIAASLAFILFVIQTVACSSLSSAIKLNYYSGCPTCLVQTLSYVVLIFYIAFVAAYSIMSYFLYLAYGIAFDEISRDSQRPLRKA